jgi:hypothetical protein
MQAVYRVENWELTRVVMLLRLALKMNTVDD